MWEDEHILITGAGTRLGKELSDHFLALGAKVTGVYFSHPVWETERHFGIKADISLETDIGRAMTAATLHFGPVSTVILSASKFKRSASLSDWDLLFHTNLRSSAIFLTLFQGKCAILIIDSFAEKGMAHFPIYASTKTALLGLMKYFQKDRPTLRVNAISPGLVLPKPKSLLTQIQIPLGKAPPGCIPNAAQFLIENSYVNGVVLRVDGGVNLY